MPSLLQAVLLSAVCAACPPSHANSVYRCVEANGRVTYLDAPCANAGNSGEQSIVVLPRNPPPTAKPIAKPQAVPEKPKVASIRLFYDPANATIEHSVAQMEELIRFASQVWSRGCLVDLQYAGVAPAVAVGSPARVSIRWNEDYMRAQHPSHEGFGIAGTGSMQSGVQLRTRMGDNFLRHVLVHEIGHVLGLPHNHEDPQSVMSYLPDQATPNIVYPSPSDYRDCNVAMKNQFGIDIGPQSSASTIPQKPRMTDKEALEKKSEAAQKPLDPR